MGLSSWLVKQESPIQEMIISRLTTSAHLSLLAHQTADTFIPALEGAMGGDWSQLQDLLGKWLEQKPRGQAQADYLSALLLLQTDFNQHIRATTTPEEALDLQHELTQLFNPLIIHLAKLETHAYAHYIQRELDKARHKTGRLDKHKSDFISVAAHEFKTPLTLIEGYANMMKTDLPMDDYPRAAAMLKGILGGTTRLREIIEDMIDLTMIEMGVMEFNFQPLWIGQIIQLAVSHLQTAAADRQISLIFDENGTQQQVILGDPERLFQTLTKVTENAIKYTPNKGKIWFSIHPQDNGLDIRIKDSGIGLNPNDQDVIFEKFFSLGQIGLHSTSKTKFKGGGPGLGLAIVRGLVQAHQGKIWVESEGYDEQKLQGSCFHIWLPLPPQSDDPLTHDKLKIDQYNSQLPEPMPDSYPVDTNGTGQESLHDTRAAQD